MIDETNLLIIDGTYGEGGGQILRTSLVLSALTGKAIRIDNIRSRRAKPGLAAQHLTVVHAMARLCRARVSGTELGSQRLTFEPQRPPISGTYAFDVAAARAGGSAGSAPLILQTLLLTLAHARGSSTVTIDGGTHLPQSPSVDYLQQIWQPLLTSMGMVADVRMVRTGWYPVGRGRIIAQIKGGGAKTHRPLVMTDRGRLRAVWGRAVAANLPGDIASRMAAWARLLLAERGIDALIEETCEQAACPGAALILGAVFDNGRGGACSLGRRGKPAEQVSQEAVAILLSYLESGGALDAHLGDQVLLPAAMASDASTFSVERVTPHLTTNAWVIERFGCARAIIERRRDGSGLVKVLPNVMTE